MKYVLCVGDGMADFSIPELNGKSPLEYAHTPNMDAVAAAGRVGLVSTVPKNLPPGSDVANMSLMGYDAALYYQGRAPIEAASMGVHLNSSDIAFRCNLVTLQNGIMDDYSAGHIETDDAHDVIALLQKELGTEQLHFYPGISYRHLMVAAGLDEGILDCTPPHDISGQKWAEHLPTGAGSKAVIEIMEKARKLLIDAPINRKRKNAGKKPVTDIWLWGQGHAITLPTIAERYGLTGSVISAVDLVQGLGVLAGLTVRKVPGATGYLGTNYAGKIDAVRAALKEQDFAYIHVEAPDETSHEGSRDKKLQAIEEFDSNIVGEVLKMRSEFNDMRILVVPDHATPLSLRTHDRMPVPYAVCGTGIRTDSTNTYSEKSAAGCEPCTAVSLFETFINGTF
jgi:2,3-bisphosphoglycerate-independent phosphoglycerate mutase